jgi:hypothetical protein
MKRTSRLLAPLLVLSLFCAAARADERADLEALRGATLNLIKLLVSEGVLSQEKANTLLMQAETAATAGGESKPATVRVPYVPEVVKEQIKQEIREEVVQQARAERWATPNTFPSWVSGITPYGDVRFRYESDMLGKQNAPALFFQQQGENISNTTEDTNRLRVRGRVGLIARLGETVEAGVGVATGTTGSTGNPVSTNNTLGTYLNKQTVGIDLAYVQWEPAPWVRMAGGRFRNPFFHSDLMWAPDLNFDGAYFSLRPRFNEAFHGNLTVGAFPVTYNAPNQLSGQNAKNKWLYGAQASGDYSFADSSKARFGVALYDYKRVEGIPNIDPANPTQFDWTAPSFVQKGNTMFNIANFGDPSLFALASKFKILNVTGEYDLARYDPVHVTLLGDYAKNLGFSKNEIFKRTNGLAVDPQVDAWQLRLQVGHKRIERALDWFAFGGYKHIESDAVLDAFNDSDFHLGGTNAKGWFVGGGLGVARNAWFGVRYLSANQISGPPLAIDVLQLDFNARF